MGARGDLRPPQPPAFDLGALACVETGDDSLLYFYLLLNRDLEPKHLDPHDLAHYATGIRFPEPKFL